MFTIYFAYYDLRHKVAVFKSAFSLILFNTLVTGVTIVNCYFSSYGIYTTLCSIFLPLNIHGVKLLALWLPTRLVFVNTPACN
ncbi:hypothetical protein EB796_011979 [Bugula neritina]|uniref:Uncharacterized protein n=1 Tax=Bugula neritina TaxID=10212 RepID=A0A7J7JUR6_BUGNE|nr:hypothetical protein EB796_011979 [Bugula neritina]